MNSVVTIDLATDDEASRATRDQLLALLDTYDLSAFVYTPKVVIDTTAIPHSHPVLTIHTRHRGQDDLLLATFLHEQLHWFLVGTVDERAVQAIFSELVARFPSAPTVPPDGGGDEESTYLHLVVNYLEYAVLRSLLGVERARAVIEHWVGDHYRWIYRQVLEREEEICELVVRNGLLPAGVAV